MKLEDFGVERQGTTLSNGVKLVLYKRAGMPIYIRASFFAGSRFDEIGKEGTAHFLEHVLTSGTEGFNSKDKLAAYIEGNGGIFSAFTTKDTMCFDVEVGDAEDLDRAFNILNEILKKPLFNDEIIDTEKKVILREIKEKEANPGKAILDVADQLLFQGTPLGGFLFGTEKSVKSLTKNDLLDFFRSNLTSGRMAIIVSGGVDLETVKKEAEEKLDSVRSEKVKINVVLPVFRNRSVSIKKYPSNLPVELIFGFRTVEKPNIDKPKLDIIAQFLGGGRASSLTKKLRYEKGLVYGVRAQSFGSVDSGQFLIKTSAEKSKLRELLGTVVSEIKNIIDKGLSEEELAFVKNKIVKSKKRTLQSSGSWVEFHTRSIVSGNSNWTIADYVEEIKSVSAEEVKKVAQKYFGPDKWYLAICGDIEESEMKVDW